LKKILLYSAVAVFLGLLLTLVPLIAVARIRPEHYLAMRNSLSEKLETLDGTYSLEAYGYSAADVNVFTISFVVALVVYMLFKRRKSHRDYRWVGPYPY